MYDRPVRRGAIYQVKDCYYMVGQREENNKILQETHASTLTCGVVMCTYNGRLYLMEQLQSLLQQQRIPDQLVIFDDCSTDGTWELLQAWVRTVSFPVIIHRNEVRQGVAKNFSAAMLKVKTDVVFLCDQDDIWLPGKISLMVKVFASEPDVLLMHTDAQLVDAQVRDLGVSLFQTLGIASETCYQKQTGHAFSVLSRKSLATGATIAFRRNLLDVAYPFPPYWLHDEWLAIMAAATGHVMMLKEQTIQYRQHGRNVVGARLPGFRHRLQQFFQLLRLPKGEFQIKYLKRISALQERLAAQPQAWPACLVIVNDMLSHARFRSSLSPNLIVRIWAMRRELQSGRYQRYSHGLLGILRDVFDR